MFCRAIAFVPGKTVSGVLRLHLQAPAVARDLGQNGCGRNGGHGSIALHDGFSSHLEHRQPVAIHQYLGWQQAQPLDRAAHGQHGGMQNVHLFNFLHAGAGNAATQCFGLNFVE